MKHPATHGLDTKQITPAVIASPAGARQSSLNENPGAADNPTFPLTEGVGKGAVNTGMDELETCVQQVLGEMMQRGTIYPQ